MIKAIQMFLSIAAVMGLLAGCQSTTGQTTGEYIDDASLTAPLKQSSPLNNLHHCPE